MIFVLRKSPPSRYDLVAASWTHEEEASRMLTRKDLPDVILVRKVSIHEAIECLYFSASFYVCPGSYIH